jgi:hypothetical protein
MGTVALSCPWRSHASTQRGPFVAAEAIQHMSLQRVAVGDEGMVEVLHRLTVHSELFHHPT